MSTTNLLTINVNEHTERKNGLTYLSWAWAWAEVLKIDPQATWEAVEHDGLPCVYLRDDSALVKVLVTIKGHTKSCVLPVMDYKNKAIKNPDAFAVNTAIVRCLTKCISMHGLGLYIYAGEDLPEEDAPQQVKRISAVQGAPGEALEPEVEQYLLDVAEHIKRGLANGKDKEVRDWLDREALDDQQYTFLWANLDSKIRTALDGARKRA